MPLRIPPTKYRAEILADIHVDGHHGDRALVARVHGSGWDWRGIIAEARRTVAKCLTCARFNSARRGANPPSSGTYDAATVWSHVAVDLVQYQVTDDGFNYVLIVVCIASRFIRTAALRNKSAATVAEELTYACAWLGVRVEVLRFSPRSTSPSVSTVPPCDISHTADGTPLIFAGSLAMWWPDPTSDVGHWEAFTGNHTTSETPATPPVSRTPPSRCLDPDSGPALPEFVISRPTVINVPDRTKVSQGPPRVTGASPRGPHATDKRPQTL